MGYSPQGRTESDTNEATQHKTTPADSAESWNGRRATEFSPSLAGSQHGKATLKTAGQFLIMSPLTMPAFLGIYPREMKIYFDAKTCTQMFYSSFIHYHQKLKEPQCPPIEECITAIHPYNRILRGSEKQQATHTCKNLDETQSD